MSKPEIEKLDLKPIDMNTKLSELTVLGFMQLFPVSRVCADFSGQPPGPVQHLNIAGISFRLLKEGEIDVLKLPGDTSYRYYLRITDNAVEIRLPEPASRVDLFVGGDSPSGKLVGLILDSQISLVDKWDEISDGVIRTHTTYGTSITSIIVTTCTEETQGLLWGICYVPQS